MNENQWIGFAGALLGGILASAAAARYSHVHALRVAWADWIASAYREMEISAQWRDASEEPETEFPAYFPDEHTYLRALQSKQEAASENLVRATQRLLLLETDEDWIDGLQGITTILVSDPMRTPEEFEALQRYLRDDVTPRLRGRLRTFLPQDRAPAEFEKIGLALKMAKRVATSPYGSADRTVAAADGRATSPATKPPP